jgi:hypothetical protein
MGAFAAAPAIRMSRRRFGFTTLATAALAGTLLVATGCMRAGGAANPSSGGGSPADSVTVALWRFDETGGTRVPDAGPSRLDGTAGLESRTGFGRIGGARAFTQSLDSFVLIPPTPLFDLSSGGFTIEAWILMNDYAVYEATPIVARWTTFANEQSWLFGVAGYRRTKPASAHISPGLLNEVAGTARPGNLIFAFQPRGAGTIRTFPSTRSIEAGRWTHVAVTYDGQTVRLWVDGQMDAQYAEASPVRTSGAPLMIGNFFDSRWLGAFGGDLRVEQALDPVPYYAFDGMIDELRLSNVARADFAHAGWGR